MAKYKIGDVLWFAQYNYTQVKKPCPVCFQKKEVTLILGNGDQIILPCQLCAARYDPPSGFVMEYEYTTKPEMIIIDRITTDSADEGKARYYSNCRVFDEDALFVDKADAETKIIELKIKLEQEQSERAEFIKKNQNKSYSWNAGYHMREAKHHREKMEYHENMAVICKAKAKDSAFPVVENE